MPKKLETRKVWVSIVTCLKCKRKEMIWHHGMTKKTANKDWTNWIRSGFNEWDLSKSGYELCSRCNQHSFRVLPITLKEEKFYE